MRFTTVINGVVNLFTTDLFRYPALSGYALAP
jgi:hypothetical protein